MQSRQQALENNQQEELGLNPKQLAVAGDGPWTFEAILITALLMTHSAKKKGLFITRVAFILQPGLQESQSD